MKRFASLFLSVLLIFIPSLSLALNWETIISAMTEAELLELQSQVETALSSFSSVPPSATSTPKPLKVRNGSQYVYSDYEGTCPFTIKADSEVNYYVYLEYQRASSSSTTPRNRQHYSSAPFEDDIAFYLAKGQTHKIDVPVGVDKLYYATGDSFYGSKLLFGENTSYFTSDDLLDFYCDGRYYNGHTITLYPVRNGNFDTEKISESSFPGKK